MQVASWQPDEPVAEVRSGETVAELYAALPESEWVIVHGMLVKRMGDPPTPEDIQDFRRIAETRGKGPI
ncbi:MAG TPA: hypothetical protein VE326_11380 [Candidatus Binatia bacterium]|nr:hypothetical protein [Candidatus Binatia bacterium]